MTASLGADRGSHEVDAGPADPGALVQPERFAHRVLLEIKRDPAITVAQFLGTFEGLTSSTKRAEVAAAADLSYKPLAALLDESGTDLDRARTGHLLRAMQARAGRRSTRCSAPSARKASRTGRGTMVRRRCASRSFLLTPPSTVWLTRRHPVSLGARLLPPAGAARAPVLIGQNFSPAIVADEMIDRGAALSLVPARRRRADRAVPPPDHAGPADPRLRQEPLAHRLRRDTEVDGGAGEDRQALDQVPESARAGEAAALPDEPKPERVTFKDAAFRAMAEAYEAASSDGEYPIISQQVFYKARPKILELTGKEELQDEERARFCYALLPQFMQEHPELTGDWRVLYKPRGELIEPHTRPPDRTRHRRGRALSRQLDQRSRPRRHRVRDAGMEGRHAGRTTATAPSCVSRRAASPTFCARPACDERHDVAIIGNEGQSVEAELVLAEPSAAGVPIFLLTDFDRQGFTIAENLRAGTGATATGTPSR